MLSKALMKSQATNMIGTQFRMISSKAQKQSSTQSVKLRGTFLQGKNSDLPTMLWFPDLVEPAANF